jgi:predicted small lipoprotein YifL
MSSISKIIYIYFCLSLISACGQTGALYLPDKSDASKTDVTTTQNLDQESVTQEK